MENDAITIMTAMIQVGGGIVEVPLRIVGDMTADALRNIVSVLWHALNQAKQNYDLVNNVGLCDMQTLMKKKGTELQFCRIKEEIKDDFYKDLKNRGCLFSELPDLNLEDGYVEIAFHATDTPKVLASCTKFKVGMLNDNDIPEGIIDMDAYINNANPEVMQGMQEAYGAAMGFNNEKKQDAPDEYTFSLNKASLMAHEDADNYYFYLPTGLVPRTEYHQELIILDKSKCTEIYDGAAIEYTLKFTDTFTLYDGRAYENQHTLVKHRDISGQQLKEYYTHQREYDNSAPHQTATQMPNAVQTPNTNKEQNPTQSEPQAAKAHTETAQTPNQPESEEQKAIHKNRKPIPKEDIAPLEDYIRKSKNTSYGKRSFTEEQIFDETDAYFFVSIDDHHDRVLAIPKADIESTQKGIYTFNIKNKPYQVFNEQDFIDFDMGGPKPQPELMSKDALKDYLASPDDIVSRVDTLKPNVRKSFASQTTLQKQVTEYAAPPVSESEPKTEQTFKQPVHTMPDYHKQESTDQKRMQAKVQHEKNNSLPVQQEKTSKDEIKNIEKKKEIPAEDLDKTIKIQETMVEQQIRKALKKGECKNIDDVIKTRKNNLSSGEAELKKPLKDNIKNIEKKKETPAEDLKKSQKISEALANQEIRKMLENATGKSMDDVLKKGRSL